MTSTEKGGGGKAEQFTIIVEGTPHPWHRPTITFLEVVQLFDPSFVTSSGVTFTVTFERGPSPRPEGPLAPGATAKVKEGMVFHVSRTGQS